MSDAGTINGILKLLSFWINTCCFYLSLSSAVYEKFHIRLVIENRIWTAEPPISPFMNPHFHARAYAICSNTNYQKGQTSTYILNFIILDLKHIRR